MEQKQLILKQDLIPTQHLDLKIGIFWVIFAIFFQILFVWHDLWVGYFLFIIAFLTTFSYLLSKKWYYLTLGEKILFLGIIGLSFWVFYLENSIITFINVILWGISLLYFYKSLHNPTQESIEIREIIKTPLIQISDGISLTCGSLQSFENKQLHQYSHIFKALFISFLLITIFWGLLYSWDLVFQQVINNIFAFINIPEINFSFLFKIFVFFVMLFLFFWFIFWIWNNSHTVSLKNQHIKVLENLQTKIIAGGVLLLFIAFLLLQISYFLLGDSIIQTHDFTYAEYAKKWYYELWLISIICYGVIYLLYVKTINLEKNTKKFLQALIFCILIFIFLAIHRLYLYENAYGLTLLRWYGFAILGFLFLVFLLLWYLIEKWKTMKTFQTGVLVLIIFIQIISNVFNPENFIANINLKNGNYNNDYSKFDRIYVSRLWVDALETQIKIYNLWIITDEEKKSYKYQWGQILESLEKNKPWYTYSYSELKAKYLLKNISLLD